MKMPVHGHTQPRQGVLVATALPLGETRSGTLTKYVQATKLSTDPIGWYGSLCSQPRLPMAHGQDKAMPLAAEKAIVEGQA